MQHIIITGLAGDGKSCASIEYASKYNLEVIHSDDYRYVIGTWKKLPFDEFNTNVLQALNANNTTKVYESTYRDASDLEDSRRKLINSLIENNLVSELLIFKPTNVKNQLSNLLTRSFNRANGTETCKTIETAKNITQYLIKCYTHYEENCKALNELCEFAEKYNVKVRWIERNNIFNGKMN